MGRGCGGGGGFDDEHVREDEVEQAVERGGDRWVGVEFGVDELGVERREC